MPTPDTLYSSPNDWYCETCDRFFLTYNTVVQHETRFHDGAQTCWKVREIMRARKLSNGFATLRRTPRARG